jgi:carbonic anhydrase/acetyltransferase-like protein (isoleucine patch superfamily)|tara:strand:- start:8 stop:517 length:510 start_codon:yes stop_codon:yes gene_type:complete
MILELSKAKPQVDKNSWVAQNAILIGKVIVKKEANVWFNVVLRGDIEPITIGERSNVQDGCVFHTDPGCPLTLGKDVTVGHMVMLHGCTIGDETLIGIGSTILNKTKIGKNCIIGANTLIAENKVIPDRSLVIGSPGKIIRQVTAKEIEEIKENANHYVDNYKKYKEKI